MIENLDDLEAKEHNYEDGDEVVQEPTKVEDLMPPMDIPDPDEVPETKKEEPVSVIDALLKSRGINDTIKIVDEAGETVETKFSELPLEEQLDILNEAKEEDVVEGLDEEELKTINFLRENNLTLDTYLKHYKEQVIEEFISQAENLTGDSTIDGMTDDELFVADLKSRIDDISDEELITALETEKQNATLFEKKMGTLRNEYKALEQSQMELAITKQREEQAAEAMELKNSIVTALTDNDGLDLGEERLSFSDEDKEEIAEFILESDQAGIRHIAKALQDPQTLVKMAWFALKGDDALQQIASYYKGKITETAKENYKKGLDAAKKGGNTIKQPESVVRKTTKKEGEYKSIDDLPF